MEAQIVSNLAEDALDATITAFTSIAAGTIRQHANILYIHKNYKDNFIECYTELTRELMEIKRISDLNALQDYDISAFIENIYKISPTAGQAQVTMINSVLKFLFQLAKLYREISLIAIQYEAGAPVLDELENKNIKLHQQNLKDWALQFPKAFHEVMQRNHIADIGPLIKKIIRKSQQEKTKVMQPVR